MGLNFLEIILCVFLLCLFVNVIFRKLQISIILGYLLVGALVGPHALGLMHDSSAAQHLAEFGIVFLMFTVGLEFSVAKLFALRYVVVFMGGLQVLLTILITTLVGIFLGMNNLSALVIGTIVAMSSTAIVIKQLEDQLELHSRPGLNAVGILLFQDLAVIPIIILIAGLAKGAEVSLSQILLWALFKGVCAIFLIYVIGHWLLRPLFRQISKTRDIELFTLTVLLVTLGGAWLTNFFGLSYALGAFLAGLMLAETEFRHQIEVEIRPFRDILLGLFFITIGMLTDMHTWIDTWYWIALLVIALIIGKITIITLIARTSGNNLPEAMRTGIILAQGGEFSFAILTLALSHDILPQDYGQVTLAALLISIAISPLLIRFNSKIAEMFFKKQWNLSSQEVKQKIQLEAKNLTDHVILCGFGRVGQHVARILDNIKLPYIGLDLDAELIRFANLAGNPVLYGDPTHPEILKSAGIDQAKVLVISFNDLASSMKIINILNQTHPNLPIIVRCRDVFELKEIKALGGSQIVIAELFEASLTLSNHLLNVLGVSKDKISKLMKSARNKDYAILQKVFTGSYEETMAENRNHTSIIKPVVVSSSSSLLNKKLGTLKLKELNVEVIAIQRGNTRLLKPRKSTKVLESDILVLHGDPRGLELAEGRIHGISE